SRLADMRAYGLALSSLSGLEATIVDPRDGSFLGSPTFVSSDPNAATYGLITAIASVRDARQKGEGAHVEISELEAAGHVGADDDAALAETARLLGFDAELPPATTTIFPTHDGQHICVDWEGRIPAATLPELERIAAALPLSDALARVTEAGGRA